MMERDKDRLKEQLKKAIQENADKPKKSKVINFSQRTKKAAPSIEINGDGNIVGNGNSLSINKKEVFRINRLPETDDINAQQKKFIFDKIHQLAERDAAKGAEIGKAIASWWSRLHKKFYVNSYACLKQTQFDDVAKWLDQQVSITRAKLRKTDKNTWRNEHYKSLNAKCRELGQKKEWLYAQALEITGANVSSLKDLTDRDLKHLYQVVFGRFPGTGKRKKARSTFLR